MNPKIPISAVLVLGALFGGSVSAQQPDSVPLQQPSAPVLQAVGGGIVGSVAGMFAGVVLSGADIDCERYDGSPPGGSVPCGEWEKALVSALAGTMIGSATGAWVGARLGGGSPSVVRTAIGAVGGVAAGWLTAVLMDQLSASATPSLLSWHVGQGTVTGLAAALW